MSGCRSCSGRLFHSVGPAVAKQRSPNWLHVLLIKYVQSVTEIQTWCRWCVVTLLDLSFQAAQRVLSAPVTSALHLLKDTSQNFPSRARSVTTFITCFSLPRIVVARRRLRSAASPTLLVPSSRRSTLGDRSFPIVASRAWNSLPAAVRDTPLLLCFRWHLKTSLFQSSFEC